MKVVITQDTPCLSKSTLCRKIVDNLDNSIYLCVDTYTEKLWDDYGFDSVEQKEDLSTIAKELFY